MKEIDAKHLAYHVLIGLYFVWLSLFFVLQFMAYNAIINEADTALGRLLLLWLSLNLVIGTSLFLVIKLFGKRQVLYRVVSGSYYVMAGLCVIVITLMLNRL